MNMMAEDLRNLRSTTTKLEKECAEIRGKFDETSVKISESLSKLQLKVEEQVLTLKNQTFLDSVRTILLCLLENPRQSSPKKYTFAMIWPTNYGLLIEESAEIVNYCQKTAYKKSAI